MKEGKPILAVDTVVKQFGETVAVDGVSLSVTEGEIVCLLGPSGCGKTTLLRLIAGLESADSGTVIFAQQNVTSTPPHKRSFGMMFQSFALFPHLNVFENVAYGLRMQGWNSAEISTQVEAMLDLVDLAGYGKRNIDQLSGGQQQRVALARSLATKPKLLMLDEPLGSLDRALREKLMVELRDIIKQIGVTAIYVTHDQSEAYAVADKVAIMQNGRIEQYATPQTLYAQPSNVFVARFLGFSNILSGMVTSATEVETEIGRLNVVPSTELIVGSDVAVLIRPNALSIDPTSNLINAMLISNTFRGRYSEVAFRVQSKILIFELNNAQETDTAKLVTLFLDPEKISILPKAINL